MSYLPNQQLSGGAQNSCSVMASSLFVVLHDGINLAAILLLFFYSYAVVG